MHKFADCPGDNENVWLKLMLLSCILSAEMLFLKDINAILILSFNKCSKVGARQKRPAFLHMNTRNDWMLKDTV